MTKAERAKKEQEFIEAEDGDAVLDAFLELLPTADEQFVEANSANPKKFIKKLQDIGASSRVITEAVSEYAGAKLMRMRCEKKRVPRKRITRVDQNLLSIYDSVNDALESRELDEKGEQARGRELLDRCKERAEQIHVNGFTIDNAVAKGELHCLANGEGYEKREIKWTRK